MRFAGRGGGRKTFASGSLGSPDAERVVTEELPAMLREWLNA